MTYAQQAAARLPGRRRGRARQPPALTAPAPLLTPLRQSPSRRPRIRPPTPLHPTHLPPPTRPQNLPGRDDFFNAGMIGWYALMAAKNISGLYCVGLSTARGDCYLNKLSVGSAADSMYEVRGAAVCVCVRMRVCV